MSSRYARTAKHTRATTPAEGTEPPRVQWRLWCVPASVESGSWILRSTDPWRRPRGPSWVSAAVSSQGA